MRALGVFFISAQGEVRVGSVRARPGCSKVFEGRGCVLVRAATGHWVAVEESGSWGASAWPERVVVDGRHVGAAGVSAPIDTA